MKLEGPSEHTTLRELAGAFRIGMMVCHGSQSHSRNRSDDSNTMVEPALSVARCFKKVARETHSLE